MMMGSWEHLFPYINILLILSTCKSQLTENQPYFRGLLSQLPGNGNKEFEPLVEDTGNIDSNPVVQIEDGILQGFTLRTVSGHAISAFQSIPYARPPVNSLRFRDPVKTLPWTGIRNATKQSSVCVQIDLVQLFRAHGEEDCLYLNVYVPRRLTGKLPVMVWIHGGFYFFGAGSIYGPRYLLDNKSVILVTFNYRLGPFGFLSTGDDASPGNQGLKDQLLALKWVRDNIASFGGDPSSVTIFGQSAGATSVGLHITSPASRGLFHRAILQSGSAFCLIDHYRDAQSTTERVAEFFKCRSKSSLETVECLRNVPKKDLASVQLKFAEWLIFPMLWFGPTVEHDHPHAFMKMHPRQYYESGNVANVPIITGLTSDELALFVSAVYLSPIHLHDINTDWSGVGPHVLDLNRNPVGVGSSGKARQIWDFYLGDRQITWETRFNASQMLSDRYFTQCTMEGMRYHSAYTKSSVYGYHFSYSGRFSHSQQVGGKPENWGVVHSDDLIYLLNNPDYYPSFKLSDPDMAMTKLMTNTWTNFARTGKPIIISNGKYGTTNVSREIWQPIMRSRGAHSPLQFLNITLNPQMIDDPYVERYNFWRLISSSSNNNYRAGITIN